MAIEKGVEWGSSGALPSDAPMVSTDAQAAAQAASGAAVVGVSDGDLARTVGARRHSDRRGTKQLLPIDVVHVELDGERQHLCVAHVVVGRLLVSRETTAIMNAAFIGSLNIAPRAHPGDGKVDVVQMTLSIGDRFKARRRMAAGGHVPHPGIKIRRVADGTVRYERPRPIRIDGQSVGRAMSIRYKVVTDALTIAIS